MKRLSKLLTILMLISMLLAVMPLDAAAAESYNVTGTVGEYFKFVFFSDNEDIVEASEYTGNVPGMKIASPSDGQLAIEGTPRLVFMCWKSPSIPNEPAATISY